MGYDESPPPFSALVAIAPADVATAEIRISDDLIRKHVQNCSFRRCEFEAGRMCAKQALSQLGTATGCLERLPDGRVAWPTGVTGSISHSGGYCCAVATRLTAYSSIGVDAELVCRADDELVPMICTPFEANWLQHLPRQQRTAGIALIFSGKEAFFKCQYTATRRWLNFTDVCLHASFGSDSAGYFAMSVLDCGHPWHEAMPKIYAAFSFIESWIITIAACRGKESGK